MKRERHAITLTRGGKTFRSALGRATAPEARSRIPLVLFGVLVGLITLGCQSSEVASQPASQLTQPLDGDPNFTIVFANGQIPADAAAQVAAAGGVLNSVVPEIGLGFATSTSATFASAMRQSPNVADVTIEGEYALNSPEMIDEESVVDETVAPTATDAVTAADSFFSTQWDVRRVKADRAWSTTTGSPSVTVAMIDAGIATNHPDLAGKVVYQTCIARSGICNPYPTTSGHGTWTAGIVAGSFGGGKVVGVAPNVTLASYNVFDDNGRFIATQQGVIKAMIDAANRGYSVINMSLGWALNRTSVSDNAIRLAFSRAVDYCYRRGTVVVASLGNDARSTDGTFVHVPGGIPLTIAVSATGIRSLPQYPQPDFTDVLAYYSNYGHATVVTAPGGDKGPPGTPLAARSAYAIRGAYVWASRACAPNYPVGYIQGLGTSAAAPHVTGVAALARSAHPNWNAYQVEARIKASAENIGDRQLFGHGMVDAEAIVH